MTVNKGNDVFLSLAGTRVNGTTTQNLNEVVSLIETTNKDSASAAKEFLGDEYESDFTVEGMYDESMTYNYTELRTAMVARAAVAFTYGKGIRTSGAELLSGNCIITSLNRTDPKNGPSVWTCGCKITGLPTNGTSAGTFA